MALKGKGGLLGDILDHGVGGNVNVLGNGFIEGLLQLGDDARGVQTPVQNSTGGVGGCVGTGNQLGESLGGQFFTAKLVAGAVLALHQASQQVNTGVVGHDLGLDTLADTGDGDTSQVGDSLKAFREEAVGNVLGEGNQRRHATQSGRDLATAVKHFNGSDILGRVSRALPHLGDIFALLEHAKGSTEGKVADDIESEVVEPIQSVETSVTSLGVGLEIGELVPLLDESLNVAVDVLLELADRLGTESVRDGLTLPGVLLAIAGVEQTPANGDESIVKITYGTC